MPQNKQQDWPNEDWIEIGRVEDIPRLGARVIKRTSGNIALFRTEEDKVFALRDKCPHKGGPLSQGIVHDCKVTCPLHNWVLDLNTGTAVAPDEGKVQTYPTRVDNGAIFLAVEETDASQVEVEVSRQKKCA